MGTTYTVGIWTVRAGREDEFVRHWDDLAQRTLIDFPDATGTLVRHSEQPNRFVSFGPWDSPEQVAGWRDTDYFKEGVARMQDLLEAFEPGTYEAVVEAGRRT